MKARKLTLIIAIAFVAMIFSFSAVQANTIALSNPGNEYRYNNGGPFIATIMVDTQDGLVGDPITGGIQFATFCLERTEYFSWDTYYSYSISDYAIGGGTDSHESPNIPDQDPLDPKSAYLYYSSRISPWLYDPKALQAAIWYIEDELQIDTPTEGTTEYTALRYVAEAAEAGWMTIGPVVVLNLYDGCTKKQSQLGLMAVPEPMTMLLLGFGLLGLGLARRKS